MKFGLKQDENKNFKQLVSGDRGYCIEYSAYRYTELQHVFVEAKTEKEAMKKFSKEYPEAVNPEFVDQTNVYDNFDKYVKAIQIWEIIR